MSIPNRPICVNNVHSIVAGFRRNGKKDSYWLSSGFLVSLYILILE